MARITQLHDMSILGDEGCENLNVKYDAGRGRLVATDGKLAIVAPVEGEGAKSVVLKIENIADALKMNEGKPVELVDSNGRMAILVNDIANHVESVPQGYPDVFRLKEERLPRGEPDCIIALDPKTLRRLAWYAEQNAAPDSAIYLCFNENEGKGVYERCGSGKRAVRWFFQSESEGMVAGLAMPDKFDPTMAADAIDFMDAVLTGKSVEEPEPEAEPKKKAGKPKAKKVADEPSDEVEVGNSPPAEKAKKASKPAAKPVKDKANPKAPAKSGEKAAGSAKAEKPAEPQRPGEDWPSEVTDFIHKAEDALEITKPALARRYLNMAESFAGENLKGAFRDSVVAGVQSWHAQVEYVHFIKKGK